MHGKLIRIFLAGLCLILLPLGASAQAEAADSELDWGILASRRPTLIGTGSHIRAVGPFMESVELSTGTHISVPLRPVYASAEIPAIQRTEWDVLWPVASGKTVFEQTSWRVLLLFYNDWDNRNPESKYKFWLMPLWGQGRTAEGKNYAGLFPIGGEFRDVLFKDRMQFILWPLWMRSQINDVVTTDVLFPIFSRTTSEDGRIEKHRAFPFYTYSKNTREFEKYSILWPFWTHATYTHPKSTGTAWVAFPLIGRVNTTSQQGWMFLPPFFQFMKGEQMNRMYCPWPFYQRETGYHDKIYVWPFYGRRTDGGLTRKFWAWPFVLRNDHTIGTRRTVRWNVVPFYFNQTLTERPPLTEEEKAAVKALARERRRAAAETGRLSAVWPSAAPSVIQDTQPQREALSAALQDADWQVTARRFAIWPLFTREYDLKSDTARFRTLDLWPMKDPRPIERNWAPLWTIFDYRRHKDAREWEFLWGLYHQRSAAGEERDFSLFPIWRHTREAGDAARRWSVLKGLLAYDRDESGRTTRFLWLFRFHSPAAE